jgi:hypothetical protein
MAATRASRWNRSSGVGSGSSSGFRSRITLTATDRSSVTSRPDQTVPMPPFPIRSITWDLPIRMLLAPRACTTSQQSPDPVMTGNCPQATVTRWSGPAMPYGTLPRRFGVMAGVDNNHVRSRLRDVRGKRLPVLAGAGGRS